MLLFIDSFDHYATPDLPLKWSSTSGPANVTVNQTAGRRGGGALAILSPGNAARKDIPGSTTVITGFAMKLMSFQAQLDPSISIHWMVLSGPDTPHLYLAVAPDGSIVVYRRDNATTNTSYVQIGNTTAGILQPNVYAYVEVKATISAASAGQVKILVNGTNVLNLTGIKTASAASTSELITSVRLQSATSNAVGSTAFFDDLYMCDTLGTANTDFFGDVRIDVVMPNADGTYTDFTPDSGTAHFSRVNEALPDQTSYVASSSVGARDSYQFTDINSIVGVVRGVQVVDVATKDDAGARSIAHLAKSGASEAYSPALPLSTDRKLYTSIFENDPATGTKWTQAGINAAEFGIVVAV